MDVTNLQEAKTRVLAAVGDKAWCRGVGIGLDEERKPSIILSVPEESRDEAERAVASLALNVPVHVRVMGVVRKRSAP